MDYSHGLVGSAHDATAFEHTTAARYPDWFFSENEFAWADSAYTCNSRTIPVHRRPASLIPNNTLFDTTVAGFRIRSEHCMGALKGRWQCLRGLRVPIRNNQEHVEACRWMTIAIILHNFCLEVDGIEIAEGYALAGGDGAEDVDQEQAPLYMEGDNAKRQQLIDQLVEFQAM